MKNSYLAIALMALLGRVAVAQVLTRSVVSQERLTARLAVSSQITPPVLRLKAPDVTALLKEDQREARQGALPRYGKPTPLALNLLAAGRWELATGGRRWQLALTSPGATSLNFFFDKFYLPPGAELYLYNGDRSVAIGPIDATQNTEAKVFATDLLKGDFVTLELFEPSAAAGQSVLHAAQVVHGYRDLNANTPQYYAGYGQAEPCNVDVSCPAGNDWQTEANAVALLILNGSYCTGTLLNDNCKSLTPNFLTAFHCIDGLDVGKAVFRFQYKSASCGGAEPTNYLSFSGAQLLAAYSFTDFALVRLNQKPPAGSSIAYAGWNRSSSPATNSASLHHAAGDVMKISLSAAVQPFRNQNQYWHTDYTVGTTQPGSSGCALFDQNHLVVGQLLGDVSRDPRSFCDKHFGDYGRFDLSWTGGGTPQTRLSDWLTTDPSVTQVPTVVNPSISGPDQVCSQTAYFQSNTTLVWSASPASLFTTTAGYGNYFSTEGAAGRAGAGVITGKLPGACEATVTKTVRVGTEPSGYFYGGGTSGGQNLQTVQFVTGGQISMFLNESANFTFSSSPAIQLSSYSGRSTSFYLPPGQGVQINVSAPGSPCALATGFVFAPRSVYYYRAAPNPVSDELLVTAADPDQPAGTPARLTNPAADSAAFETTLYDNYGRPVKTERSERGQAVLDVRDLPNGLYHLRTGHGKDVVTEHIRVTH